MMETIGHLHPLLIHFPIGLLLAASVLIIYARIAKKDFDSFIQISLWVGFVFSMMASVSGWVLSNFSQQDANSLLWHQWTAIATCFLAALLVFLKKWRFHLSFILFGAICFTGHLGSVLTYGEGYFSLAQKKVATFLAPEPKKTLGTKREAHIEIKKRSLALSSSPIEILDAPNSQWVQEFQARQISIVEQNDRFLSANFLHIKNDFDGVFFDFQKLAPWVVQLKLANQKNIDFTLLKNFTKLSDLDLSKTNFVDGDLVYLRDLAQLKRLNLVGTHVSDAGLSRLMALKSLKKVYVWQTLLSAQAVEKWKQANPNLEIETGQFSFVKPDSLKTITR
jgi:uncharacterized membrane protein